MRKKRFHSIFEAVIRAGRLEDRGKACFVEDEDGNVGHMHSISSSGSPDFIHVSFVHKITAATYTTVLHS